MKGIPDSLLESVQASLMNNGDLSPIKHFEPSSGGCINTAGRIDTDQGSYFLKWNPNSPEGLFRCEYEGLRLIASTSTVRVPAVLSYAEKKDATPAYVILEWLEGGNTRDQALLGEQLAALHISEIKIVPHHGYGLDHDNYLGVTLQKNQFHVDWLDFFQNCRLQPIIELCQSLGRIPPRRLHLLDKLFFKLPALLEDVNRRPSLIHGDLWAGNVIPYRHGFALIDPAVSFSDREAELAYTELFGGFNQSFYTAYQSVWPLEPGYADRRDIYNLYHLLNHLYLFGEAYGSRIDSILIRYIL